MIHGSMTLRRPAYLLVVPVFLIFAALACAGTPLLDVPIYICPTNVPPTAAPVMTLPPGLPTAVPPPIPPPTPYIITPPQDFYLGDAVFVGVSGSPVRVRFRLQNVRAYPASPSDGQPRSVYAWQLEVKNVGAQDYEVFPALQMYLSTVSTASGDVNGAWGSSQAAADEAGLTIDNEVYTLTPGVTRVFRFAAYGPAGGARRFIFTLDPTVTEGSATITWVNQTNPYCSGDVADY